MNPHTGSRRAFAGLLWAALGSLAPGAMAQDRLDDVQPARQPAAAAGKPSRPADLSDASAAQERRDDGVAPIDALHNGPMHGPTPASIPGGQVITTKGLVALVQGRQVPFLLFDVLGRPERLPGAIPAVAAAQPGHFQDEVQRGFGDFLAQATRGDKRLPLVFYCQSTHCWMSYNAALRAIHMGYRNVLWYRGGLEAWQAQGLALEGAAPGMAARQ
jgi:PQQ-dependent catabolism-associated CXXCW motif protein